MYLDWVLPCLAILTIVLLVCAIYQLYKVPEGFALVQTPNQTYTIPILEGVTGRYVRIRPSLTGDGFLTISQLQVIDINGENIALKKPVYATSDGGSEVDRMFGRLLNINGFNQFRSGISDGPSCVVDGVLEPRNSLENVFETGVQNTAANDTQYLEIDLGGNSIISSIVYIGRGDAETRSITDINAVTYNLTQVDRQRGMRVELWDATNKLTFGGTGVEAAKFPTTDVKQTMKITSQMFTVNASLGSAAAQKDTITIPNVKSYKDFAEVFRTATPLVPPPVSTEVSPTYIPDINPTENNKELIKALYDAQYKTPNVVIDLSNNIFPGAVSDYPISFYNDFYTPVCATTTSTNTQYCRASTRKTLNPTITISIFGAASATAKAEMTQSINLCKKLYLGSQAAVENYVRIEYSSNLVYKVYLRGSCTADDTPKMGVSDLIQVFEGGNFVTKLSTTNQTFTTGVFQCPLGSSGGGGSSGSSGSSTSAPLLALIPYGSRLFLIDWIYNRMMRYRAFAIDKELPVDLDNELAWSSNNDNFSYRASDIYNLGFEYSQEREICSRWLNSNPVISRRKIIKNNTPSPTVIEFTLRKYKSSERISGTCPNIRTTFPNAATKSDAYELALSSMLPIRKLTVPIYIDVRSTALMDSIAQQFYEMLDGNFAMTYIYDAFPLGSTMLDMRFQLYVHDDVATSYGPINDLKAQYQKITSATTQTQDVLDQAEYDYQSTLFDLQEDAIQSTLKPFEGAVARLFYEKTTAGVRITGLIFDAKAVTSFIPELNGGIAVPIGPSPGNINYEPTLVYSKNRTETLDCTNQTTLKRVMHDYVNMMNDSANNYPLSRASPPIHVTKGDLVVTEVLGSQQVSDTQCAVTWKESLYDPYTNTPKPISTSGGSSGSKGSKGPSVTEVTRSGLLSYSKDTETWFAGELTPDITGFKLFSAPTVPECKFNPEYYRTLYPTRYTSSTTRTTLIGDFLRNDFKGGLTPICPDAIPKYLYNPVDAGGTTLADYMATHIYTEPTKVVRAARAITPLTPSFKITKPIPTELALDNLSNLCPAASCKDLDVLYTLVDQYNSDSTLPGTILSVTHAFTPNPYQCDVKVSMNYGGLIEIPSQKSVIDPATGLTSLKPSYEKVVKGTVTYKSGSRGEWIRGSTTLPVPPGEIKNITLALYPKLDPLTCTYILADASGQNSGLSIQPNTPDLYAPMIYSNELIKRNIGKLDSTGSLTLSGKTGSAISAIQSDFTKAIGSTKQTLKSYRMQTYGIAGSINSLGLCKDSPPCNSSGIQGIIKDYFKTRVVTTGEQIDTILRTSSIDGKSCDATFTTTSNRTLTNRFLFTADVANSQGCSINGHIGTQDLLGNSARGSVATQITDEQILDIRKELSTTLKETFIPYKNPSVSAFTNYSATSVVAPEALDVRSFGQDSGRNTEYSIQDAQFETPLVQNLPSKKRPARKPPAYKFLRFTPLETRSRDAAAVNVGKFIFFYDEYPLFLKGTVTNPMGTWEGTMADVIGPDIRPGWSDAHKKSLTFAFRDPIAVDAYSFTTALPEMGIDGDPISWKLEGSANGTFWTILDTQKGFATPITRFADLDKIYITTEKTAAT